MRRQLPNGLWFSLGNVPSDADATDIQHLLYRHGIQVGEDRIDVTSGMGHKTAALISLPQEEVRRLFGFIPNRFAVPKLEEMLAGATMMDGQGTERCLRFFTASRL